MANNPKSPTSPLLGDLRPIFLSHCTLINSSHPPTVRPPPPTMDSAHFSKLLRLSTLQDGKRIKPQDVDVAFSKAIKVSEKKYAEKARPKDPPLGKKITWEGFLWAVEELSKSLPTPTKKTKATPKGTDGEETANPDASESPPTEGNETQKDAVEEKESKVPEKTPFERAVELFVQHVPVDEAKVQSFTGAAKSSSSSHPAPQTPSTPSGGRSIWTKLTDTRLYTGTHKERFDQDGKGKGLAGRDPIPPHSPNAHLLNRKPTTVTGIGEDIFERTNPTDRQILAAKQAKEQYKRELEEEALEYKAKQEGKMGKRSSIGYGTPPKSLSSSNLSVSYGSGTASPKSDRSGHSGGAPSSPGLRSVSSGSNSAIFDRLNDPRRFGGSHRERFDTQTGKGKGLEGRRDPAPKKFREADK